MDFTVLAAVNYSQKGFGLDQQTFHLICVSTDEFTMTVFYGIAF